MDRRKLAIGFIIYGESNLPYLSHFIPSLREAVARSGLEVIIMAWNNGPIDYSGNLEYLKRFNDIVIFGSGENLGFARANNNLITKAREANVNYFLALNPDMIFEADAIKEMLRPLETDNSIAAISPKVRRWDFANLSKTGFIDTCGIAMPRALQFVDIGQGEIDQGQYDHVEIMGPSGCASLYRMSALARLKTEHGYFDERFFMYKEDCDLAYRLKRLGLKSVVARLALVYHDRTATNKNKSFLGKLANQKNKSTQVRAWSYYGQWLLVFKYWVALSLINKLVVIYYQFLGICYAVIFDRNLLKEIKRANVAVATERGINQ